jgi:hypothetical protein
MKETDENKERDSGCSDANCYAIPWNTDKPKETHTESGAYLYVWVRNKKPNSFRQPISGTTFYSTPAKFVDDGEEWWIPCFA